MHTRTRTHTHTHTPPWALALPGRHSSAGTIKAGGRTELTLPCARESQAAGRQCGLSPAVTQERLSDSPRCWGIAEPGHPQR